MTIAPVRRIVFVCVENSCRSQMAEGFARMLAGPNVEIYSAGSRPSGVVNPKAIASMREIGYDLAPHAFVQVDFDLYLIRSWDGESTEYGKDYFGFRAGDSQLFRETFSNGGAMQTYCGSACVTGQSVYAPMTGAAERYSLGYGFDNWLPESPKHGTSEVMDSVYRFSFTFAHAASNLELGFFAQGLQANWVAREGGGYWDESWGLDNVSVHLLPVPEPQTWALLLAGLALAFAARRRVGTDF